MVFVLSKRKLCNCGCSGFHTIQAFMKMFAWSMSFLAKGTWPSARHNDIPFTARERKLRIMGPRIELRAGLLQLRGDWEWMTVCFRFRSPSQNLFCYMCNCTREDGPMCYLHTQPNAAHRGTMISHRAYLEAVAAEGGELSSIFQSPGMRFEYAAGDSMHAGDLGPFQDAIGSLFWMHVTCKRLYRNKAAGLHRPLTHIIQIIPSQPHPPCIRGIVYFNMRNKQ